MRAVFNKTNSGALADIAVQVIRPYYQSKFAVLEATINQAMPKDLPWFLHRGEGAIFAWLWLQDLPLSDWEFYQQLKQSHQYLLQHMGCQKP